MADAAVIGTPHPTLGECIVAFVECRGNQATQAVERSILRMARAALPVAKAPRRLYFVDDLPRNANRKVDRLMPAGICADGEASSRGR